LGIDKLNEKLFIQLLLVLVILTQTSFQIRYSMHAILLILTILFVVPFEVKAQQAKELRRYMVPQAKQAVAVDNNYFYVINNSSITKHRKEDGKLIASWDGTQEGILTHLNSGIVIEGKLYCAHSNYPQEPMASSIEVFDTQTLEHIDNHSFGIMTGSATWIDSYQGYWWVGFAHYTGKGASEGKDTRWTSVVKFNKAWQQVESWIFPKQVIEQFMPKSNSGGVIGKDGVLYCTGHDKAELYVMQIPDKGYTLQHLKTIPITIEGQGIALDLSMKDKVVFYGISRAGNTVIVNEIY